jgi:hypothetical protein
MADSNSGGPTPPTMEEAPKVPASPYATPQASLGQEGVGTQLGGGSYTLGEIMSAGWAGFTDKLGIGLGIALIFILIHGLGSNIPFLNLLYVIAVQFPLQAGLALVGIKLADAGLGRNPTLEVGDLFSGFSKYWSCMGAGWLMVLIIGLPAAIIGVILAVVGGLVGGGSEEAQMIVGIGIAVGVLVVVVPIMYVALRLAFAFYLIMDQDMGAIDSLKQSWALTNGHVLNLFVLGLVAAGAMLAGTLLLIVGIFPAIVFVWAMFGAAYRKITNT